MKNTLLCLILFFAAIITKAGYIETYNVISDDYISDIQDANVIRVINGGTVITPVFDESCPEELKAPFSYACKIIEEYMPPCLPLKVKVSCGRVNSSSKAAVSKVRALSMENFGDNIRYQNVQMSMIKGVILAELGHDSSVTYLDSVPNIEFLTDKPDIDITYNNQKLDEFSFSLEPDPEQKYDFVSLAIRDLLIGLGISSSYRYDPTTRGLLNPSQLMTPFELFINEALGNYGDPIKRLANATRGSLLLKSGIQEVDLYAPTTWLNGVSLNYFIPQDNCSISNILSYNFCKGMVTRSLSDDFSRFFFRDLLGWKPSFVVSISSSSSSSGGSTSLLMPYNGSISFDNNTLGMTMECVNEIKQHNIKMLNNQEKENLYNYVQSFHPFQYEESDIPLRGMSVSILKKDGTWDLVKYFDYNVPYFSMSDLKFNYDETQYARTIDGYLRARITTKQTNSHGGSEYKSTFFVIDYLPQKVDLSFKYLKPVSSLASQSVSLGCSVRVYFSNTEGLDRIVIEQLRKGSRVPSKVEVKDFKKGYFDATITKTTTFTAVGYNANGTSRSVPIIVSPILDELSVKFKQDYNRLYIESDEQLSGEYNYTITPLLEYSSCEKLSGTVNNFIDISSLSDGMYILNIVDNNTGMSKTFKFKK